MDNNAKQQLLKLHRSLYKKAFEEAHAYAKGTSKLLLAYSDRFESSLPRDFERVKHEYLLSRISKSNILLFGDFHTLKQSQRGLLRILRSLTHKKRKKREIILALESFKFKDQQYINEYLAGNIDENEFLAKTNYKTDWGFPWANFRMLIDFAREQRIKVIGINSPNAGKDSLATRDSYAAKILTKEHSNNPQALIVCLIGEYHLADEHLPKSIQFESMQLQKHIETTRLLTNVDRYFFELPQDKPAMTTDYIHLRDNLFCIMNSPPWMKWQSYTIWEELRSLGEMDEYIDDDDDDEFDLYTEQTYDIDYHFLNLVKDLAGFLNIDIPEGMLGSFSIHETIQEDLIKQLDSDRLKKNHYTETALERANLDGFYFFAKKSTILLTKTSINNLSESSGQFLHYLSTNIKDTEGDSMERFYSRILRTAAGMISAKILNPRRKCLSLFHFQKFIDNNFNKKLSGHPKNKRLASISILKHHRWIQSCIESHNGKPYKAPHKIFEQDIELNYETSHSIGLLLGNQLYSKVMANKVAYIEMKNLFAVKLDSSEKKWTAVANLYKLAILE